MSLEVALRHRLGAFELDVAFTAPAGITALFGRSGAGKTTVVEAVAGLLTPREGRVALDGDTLLDTAAGVALPPRRRRIGYVFQDGRLFPHMTVRRNLAYGRRFARPGGARPDTGRIVELLGIGDLLDRRPGRLSGGEKQRVAIGRAMLAAPRLLLMDEPLAALDEVRRAEILPYLERLRDEVRIPVIYVSHAVSEVARLATTVVALDSGRVARAGPAAEVLSDPQSVPTVGARAAGAVLPARVARHHPADGLTELAVSAGPLLLPRIAAAPGTSLRIRVEAHDVILALRPPEAISALNVLPATVAEIFEGGGPGAAVGLVAGDDRLLARITRRSVRALGLAPGVSCYAILKSTSVAPEDIGGVSAPRRPDHHTDGPAGAR